MQRNHLVLFVAADPSDRQDLQQVLGEEHALFRLQHAGSVAMALARIGGGGVDAVALDMTTHRVPEAEALDQVRNLHANAPNTPILFVCRSEDESLAQAALRAGAADCGAREQCAEKLARLIRLAAPRSNVAAPRGTAEPPRAPGVVTLLGVKGGVGTTSVALNVACALAERTRVIVVELQPALATLSHFFQLSPVPGTTAELLKMSPSRTGPDQIERFLWPCRRIPGLSVLFGPQSIEDATPFEAAAVKAVLSALASLADTLVVDLPATFSEANIAAIQGSDALGLVLERDPVSVSAAKLMVRKVGSVHPSPRLIGAVVVNRAPLSVPIALTAIESQLGIPLLGAVAPAPDLFLAAQNARMPVVAFEPASVAAGTLTALAESLAARTSALDAAAG